MLAMVRDLVAHKGHANAALLDAVGANPEAAADPDVRDLLHHVLLANRFWLLAVLEQPFVHDDEAKPAASLADLADRYEASQAVEEAWLRAASDGDLERLLVHPLIPGGSCSVAQAFVQVCLHAHGHRAQCAKLLRRHGSVAPPSDFILWLAAKGSTR